MRPSETLQAVIDGRIDRSEAPHWTRAGLSMATYRHACKVLSERARDARREALDRVPEAIRDDVESEAKRLWKTRQPK